MSAERPDLSIIIPVCNIERYLRECLDSAVNQTLRNIEIICIDDGSTDSSSTILDEYAQRDDRFVIRHKANAGFGHTMNVGLGLARGRYVAFLESDDFIVENAYEKLVRTADACGADIVKGDYFEIRGRAPAYERKDCRMMGRTELYGKLISPRDEPYLFYVPMMNPMGIFRRDFLEGNAIRHNETPGASYQDMGFWFQAFCLARRVYYVREPFYCYRKDNPGSSMNNMGKAACVRDEYRFMWEFLVRHPDIMSWAAPIYYHRLFGSFMFRFIQLPSWLKTRFLMEVFRPELELCASREHFSAERFSALERDQMHSILHTPDAFLTKALARVDVNAELFDAYCVAESRMHAYAAEVNGNRLGGAGRECRLEDGISVVIPVYNAERYIGACLDSICGQTYDKLDIVCVDDGSTDQTLKRLKEYAKGDPRIRVVHQKNRGQSAARNVGLTLTHRKYVYFMDSDDRLAVPQAFARLLAAAEENQSEIVYFDSELRVEGDASKVGGAAFNADTYRRKHDYSSCTTGRDLLVAFVNNREYSVSPCLVFFRRDFLDRNNLRFYEGIIYEDNIFAMECALAAKRARHLPAALYSRLVRGDSTMTGRPTFRNLYGYLTCYIQLFKLSLENDKDDLVMEVIGKQLEACRWQVRRLTRDVADARAIAARTLTQTEYGFYRELVKAEGAPVAAKAVSNAGVPQTGRSVSRSRGVFARGVQCLRENGVSYTLGDLVGKIIGGVIR